LAFCSFAMTSRASAQTSTAAARPVLVIQSTPGGAQVYVDDEPLGTTSPEGRLRISTLKPGKHTLRLSLDGRSYGEGQFTLVAGKSLTKIVTLPEQANALSQPQKAQPSPSAPAAQTQQSGPTLDETAAWLVAKLGNNNVSYVTHVREDDWVKYEIRYEDVTVSDCVLKWTSRFHASSSNVGPQDQSFTGRYYLRTASPGSFKATQFVASDSLPNPSQYRQTGDTFMVTGSSPSGPIGGSEVSSLEFGDLETANRVANALNHSATVCGGKTEPF